jgi:hypothetical protein
MPGLINYIKKAFKNYPDTTTRISAENLNHLDDGIYDLDQAAGQLNDLVKTKADKSMLIAEDNLEFKFSKQGSNYGYLNASGNFVPFKNPTGSKSITANGIYNIADYASAIVNVSCDNQASGVFNGPLDDNGDGQDITYTYTATQDGYYCMIGFSYRAGDGAGTDVYPASTTGIMVNQGILGSGNDIRYCTMRIAFVRLKKNQTVSMTIPSPGGPWPLRTIKVWLVGNY